MAKVFTPEEELNIVQRYQRGQSIDFIRQATGGTRVQVKDVLKKHGIRIRSAYGNRGSGFNPGFKRPHAQ